jgi:hypothetical protein
MVIIGTLTGIVVYFNTIMRTMNDDKIHTKSNR